MRFREPARLHRWEMKVPGQEGAPGEAPGTEIRGRQAPAGANFALPPASIRRDSRGAGVINDFYLLARRSFVLRAEEVKHALRIRTGRA